MEPMGSPLGPFTKMWDKMWDECERSLASIIKIDGVYMGFGLLFMWVSTGRAPNEDAERTRKIQEPLVTPRKKPGRVEEMGTSARGECPGTVGDDGPAPPVKPTVSSGKRGGRADQPGAFPTLADEPPRAVPRTQGKGEKKKPSY